MTREIQQLSIFIIFFLLGCAAQGPVTGGPADEKGPTLITVQPANLSLNITLDQKITLTFDELLDPVSIPASIQREFDLDYSFSTSYYGIRAYVIPVDLSVFFHNNSEYHQ